LQALKEIFRCDTAMVGQLAVFGYKDLCLPEIFLYYLGKGAKWTNPRALGILIGNNSIKLIDESGIEVLMLTHD
jgi:hypothetical protein